MGLHVTSVAGVPVRVPSCLVKGGPGCSKWLLKVMAVESGDCCGWWLFKVVAIRSDGCWWCGVRLSDTTHLRCVLILLATRVATQLRVDVGQRHQEVRVVALGQRARVSRGCAVGGYGDLLLQVCRLQVRRVGKLVTRVPRAGNLVS